MFNPISLPIATPPDKSAETGAVQPIAPPPPPPAIVFQKPAPKPSGKTWDTAIVRKAQDIYPAEANAKASQIATAKMPTPTGSWGKPA
jgi:hypothetical protein